MRLDEDIMKKRNSRRGVISETEDARVELVAGEPSEPLSLDEVRVANAEYLAALTASMDPAEAVRAIDELVDQVRAARKEAKRRGDVHNNIRVTRLR